MSLKNPSYQKSDLLAHVEKRRSNIKIFEDAIEKERAEIEKEQKMIAVIEAQENGSKN